MPRDCQYTNSSRHMRTWLLENPLWDWVIADISPRYYANLTDFTLEDIIFMQAITCIVGPIIEF